MLKNISVRVAATICSLHADRVAAEPAGNGAPPPVSDGVCEGCAGASELEDTASLDGGRRPGDTGVADSLVAVEEVEEVVEDEDVLVSFSLASPLFRFPNPL